MNLPFRPAKFDASMDSMISLIATVLNEGESIRQLLDSIIAQTRPPDEIVIVDGGSSDDTVAIMKGYSDRLPLQVIALPGCNISAGRNCAIRAARGDIIAVTDAGVRLKDTWLDEISAPLLRDSGIDGVAGFFVADPQSRFELALAATTLPLAREINPETFLPSSRSIAFSKSAAEKVGLYPEWLDYCEDLIFDLRLKAQVGQFIFAPEAIAYFRPRSTAGKFFRQYFLYAGGDGKAKLWSARHFIRYATYLLLVPLIFALGLALHPFFWLLYLAGGVVYLYQPYRRLPILMRRAGNVSAVTLLFCIIMIPALRLLGDLAKMLGYPCGRWWRLRHHPPDWR